MAMFSGKGTGILGDYSTGGGTGMGGLLGGMQQQQPEWAQGLGLFSSALKDASAAFSGQQDPGALAAWNKSHQQNQIRQQLLQGMQSSDPAVQKQVAMYALANGIDPTAMLNLNRPKIEHVGDDLVSVDPFDPTNPKTIRSGEPAAPSGYSRNPDHSLSFIKGGPGDPAQASALSGERRQPPPGYQWSDPTHTKVSLIPGYLGGAGELAGARRKPAAPGAGPSGNPAALFGGGR